MIYLKVWHAATSWILLCEFILIAFVAKANINI